MNLFNKKPGIEEILNQIKDREKLTLEDVAVLSRGILDNSQRDRRVLRFTYVALVVIGGAIAIGGTYLTRNENIEKDKGYCMYLQMAVPKDFKEIRAPYTDLPCLEVLER